MLLNHNNTYQQNNNIKLAGVDPFDPEKYKKSSNFSERTESDVRVFLSKILPTLMQDHYAESTRIRTLINYCRGSARDYLSNYPQDGSVSFRTIVDDLDYFFFTRQTPHTLMKQLHDAVRKPGDNILQYCLQLKKSAERLKKIAPGQAQSTVNLVWFKILAECPSELKATIQQRFDTHQINDILAFIGNYTANYPEKSPFTAEKLAEEKRIANKNKFKSIKNDTKKSSKTATTAAIPALPSSESISTNVITCFNCKRPGHMARDCHDGGQNQTVPKDRKVMSKSKTHVKKESGKTDRKCKICLMNNHTAEYCRLLDRVKSLLKQNTDGAKVHFMEMAMDDPWNETLAPIRDTLCQEVDWQSCQIETDGISEVITAALKCEDTWDWSENSSECSE